MRLVNDQGVVHCVLLIGKATVSPLKYVSILRFELVAATLSDKIASLLREELDFEINKKHFWTDPTVVLGYISNSSKRFKIFVGNGFSSFHVAQWPYLPTAYNPADDSSRGLDVVKSSKLQR